MIRGRNTAQRWLRSQPACHSARLIGVPDYADIAICRGLREPGSMAWGWVR